MFIFRGDKMGTIRSMIGERLRGYRISKGLTQEDLADLADVHFTYIGKIERGEINFTIDSIVNVSTALNVSLDELFRYSQPTKENEGHDLSLIVSLLQNRNIEDQKKALHLLEFVLNWTDK
jgi:transcriptional regulator with XRE-family HTH domain